MSLLRSRAPPQLRFGDYSERRDGVPCAVPKGFSPVDEAVTEAISYGMRITLLPALRLRSTGRTRSHSAQREAPRNDMVTLLDNPFITK